mmetsp:Transcript_35334/g.46794  ORF Transcript_35334/g.46794 Transcript_35334/m.46794 type:complete len:86 (-) Transcript_35334:652-909(-)
MQVGQSQESESSDLSQKAKPLHPILFPSSSIAFDLGHNLISQVTDSLGLDRHILQRLLWPFKGDTVVDNSDSALATVCAEKEGKS